MPWSVERNHSLVASVRCVSLASLFTLLSPSVAYSQPAERELAQPLEQETLDQTEQEGLDQQRRFEGWQQEQNDLFQTDPDIFLEAPGLPLGEEAGSDTGPCFPVSEVQLVSEEYQRFRWLERQLNEQLEGQECLGR